MMVSVGGGVWKDVGEEHVAEEGEVKHVHIVEEVSPVDEGSRGGELAQELFGLYLGDQQVVSSSPRMREIGSAVVLGKKEGGEVYADGKRIDLSTREVYKAKSVSGLEFEGI